MSEVKPVDANRTQVLIHVFEKGVGRVGASHLFKFLSQADKMKLLEQQLKCARVIPLTEFNKEALEKYNNTPPEGFDLNYWLQGVRRNPRPEQLLATPVYGFEQLMERQKQQKSAMAVQQQTLESCESKREQLDRSVGWYVGRLKACQNAHKQLGHR